MVGGSVLHTQFAHHVEAAFARVLVGRMDSVHQRVQGEVIEMWRRRDARRDAIEHTAFIEQLGRTVRGEFDVPTGALHEMATRVDRHVRAQLEHQIASVVGVDTIELGPARRELLDEFVERNTQLITSLDERYIADVRGLIADGVEKGHSVSKMAELLKERAGVSSSRARVIARDQVATATRQMTQARHEEAGVTEYTWSTSSDERVRPACKKNHGKTFSWARGDGGEHPGDRVMCRCQAIPVSLDAIHDREHSFSLTRGRSSELDEAYRKQERWEQHPSVAELRQRLSDRRSGQVTSAHVSRAAVDEILADASSFCRSLFVPPFGVDEGAWREEVIDGLMRELREGERVQTGIHLQWLERPTRIRVPFREPVEIGPVSFAESVLAEVFPPTPTERAFFEAALDDFHQLLGQANLGPPDARESGVGLVFVHNDSPLMSRGGGEAEGFYRGSARSLNSPFRGLPFQHDMIALVWHEDLEGLEHLGLDVQLITQKTLFFHEYTHLTEMRNEAMRQAAVYAREVLLQRGEYGDYQETAHFRDYATRLYDFGPGVVPGTEVNTRALEALSSPDRLLGLWELHPLHFAYLVALLEGRFGYNE